MAHAEHTVTVSRPAEEVFDFVVDGTRNPQWRPSVVDVERAESSDGAGAVWRQGMKGLGGRRVTADYRITEAVRPSRLSLEVIAGPARPTGTYTFTAAGPGQTTVTFALDLQPRGLMCLIAPMINKQVRQEVTSLDNLKSVLER